MTTLIIDTNILYPSIMQGSKKHVPHFANWYTDHIAGELNILVPKCVQAELYGLLKACRMKRRMANSQESQIYCYSHEEIMSALSEFNAIFDLDYLDKLKNKEWRTGGSKRHPFYKETLKECIEEEYGWNDWGQRFIEKKLNCSLRQEGKKDKYDYPIMATALLFEADLIVTDNLKDFLIPTGHILVWNFDEAAERFYDELF